MLLSLAAAEAPSWRGNGGLAPLHAVRRPPSPSRWERKDAENQAYLRLEEQQAQLRRESERAAAQPPPESKGKGKKGKR